MSPIKIMAFNDPRKKNVRPLTAPKIVASNTAQIPKGRVAADAGAEILKGLLSPVYTMIARPFQAGAELAGVSDEKVNKFSQKYTGGLIVPTPQNIRDFKKDVGRAIETIALGIPAESIGGKVGSKLIGAKKLTKANILQTKIMSNIVADTLAGSIFGAGYGLEQGENTKGVLKETAKGGVIAGLGGQVLRGIGRGLSKKPVAPQVVEEVVPENIQTKVTPDSIGISEITPTYKPEPKNIIEVNGKKFITPTKEYREYLQAKKVYDYEVGKLKADLEKNPSPSQYEYIQKQLKAKGMQFSATKRKLTGDYTATELDNIVKKEQSNYLGKKVKVKTSLGEVDGIISSNSKFGLFEVKLKNGKIQKFKTEQIKDTRSYKDIINQYTKNRKEYIPEIENISVGNIKTKLPETGTTKTQPTLFTPEQNRNIQKAIEKEEPNFKSDPNWTYGKQTEDPMFQSGTFEKFKSDYSMLKTQNTTDDLIDIVMGKKPNTTTTPNTAIYEMLKREKNLSVEQKIRLVNTLPESKAGQELVATRLRDSSVIFDNDVDLVKAVEKKLKDKSLKQNTRKTLGRFLDDLECK